MAQSIPEGTVFRIEKSQCVLFGVVARRVPRGRVVATYLFPWPDGVAGGEAVPVLPDPSVAGYRGKFTDHALRDGTWPTMGIHPDFRREEWPFAEVLHVDFHTGQCVLVKLDDRNPLKELSSETVACAQHDDVPSDVLRDPFNFMQQLPESYAAPLNQ